jgi:hypothetical protein
MKQMYIFPSLASVYAKLATLQGTDVGQGANLIGVQDADGNFTGDTVEEVLAELKNAIPIAGATGSFTTADSKTVTVTNGIITSIV